LGSVKKYAPRHNDQGRIGWIDLNRAIGFIISAAKGCMVRAYALRGLLAQIAHRLFSTPLIAQKLTAKKMTLKLQQ
jgi:hypothetical protein